MPELLGLGNCTCLTAKEKYYISGVMHNEIEKRKEDIEKMKRDKMIPESSIDVYAKMIDELKMIKQKADITPVCSK